MLYRTINWNLRKFADASNGSEKIGKAVEPVEHIDTFPMDVYFFLTARLRKFHILSNEDRDNGKSQYGLSLALNTQTTHVNKVAITQTIPQATTP